MNENKKIPNTCVIINSQEELDKVLKYLEIDGYSASYSSMSKTYNNEPFAKNLYNHQWCSQSYYARIGNTILSFREFSDNYLNVKKEEGYPKYLAIRYSDIPGRLFLNKHTSETRIECYLTVDTDYTNPSYNNSGVVIGSYEDVITSTRPMTKEEIGWLEACRAVGKLVKRGESMEATVEEAKRRYPVGTIFNSTGGNKDCIIKPECTFNLQSDGSIQIRKDDYPIGYVYSGRHLKRWAEIISKPEPKVEEEPIVVNTQGFCTGDSLPEELISEWARVGGINYNCGKGWQMEGASFQGDRKVVSFEIIDGQMGFLVSDTADVYLKAEGFKEFRDNFYKKEKAALTEMKATQFTPKVGDVVQLVTDVGFKDVPLHPQTVVAIQNGSEVYLSNCSDYVHMSWFNGSPCVFTKLSEEEIVKEGAKLKGVSYRSYSHSHAIGVMEYREKESKILKHQKPLMVKNKPASRIQLA